MDMIAERVIAARERGWQDTDERGLARRPHARASPTSAARRSTTRRTTSSRSSSPRWARSRSRTRPAYDTRSTVPGLGTSFGRGGATNFQQDLAERRLHPDRGLATWPRRTRSASAGSMKAQERGATIIHVDPRFSRTSAMADLHVPDPRRQRHRLPRRADPPRARDRVVLQGVRPRTTRTPRRSSTSEFKDTEDLGGCFSGFDPETGHLRPGRRWKYEGGEVAAPAGTREHADAGVRASSTGAGMLDGAVQARRDARSTRAACFQSCAATTRATRPRWSSGSAASPQEDFLARGRDADRATRAASARPRSATPSAGRSTPPACR